MKNLLKDYEIKLLIDNKKIKEHCHKIAKLIEEEYKNKDLMIICILKGAYLFFNQVLEYLEKYDVIIEFLKASSFCGTMERSECKLEIFDNESIIKNKNIIVFDDIIDSGITLYNIKNILLNMGAREVKITTLLDKDIKRDLNIKLDYPSIKIPNVFVIGYGLDISDKYRNLKNIYVLEKNKN